MKTTDPKAPSSEERDPRSSADPLTASPTETPAPGENEIVEATRHPCSPDELHNGHD